MKFDESLPKGWALTRCSDFCSGRNQTFNPAKAGDEEFILYSVPSHETGKPETVRASEIGSNKQFVSAGDTLISKINPRLNRTWVVGQHPGKKIIASTEWIVFGRSSAFVPEFLSYFLRQGAVRDFLSHNASGVGGSLTRIRASIFDEVSLPLPPLAEQKRIVAKIEELFSELEAGEESLRVARRQLGVYRQSLLKQAFEGHLTAKWRTQNPAGDRNKQPTWDTLPNLKTRRDVPDAVQISELLEDVSLPAGWVLRSTAHLLKKGVLLDVKDGNHGTNHPKKSDFTATGLPFLTAAEIRGFKIDFEGAHKIEGPPLEKLRVGFSKPRDVILTHKGSVGRVAVNDREAMLSPQTTYYRCSESVLLPEFLCYFISSPLFVAQLGEVKGQTTRDFVPISKQYFLFSVVAPLPEQQEIVRLLDEQFEVIERNEREIDGALRQSEALRQAILQKAFTGRLVPQVATDEPASTLLNRLRASRSAATGYQLRSRDTQTA